MKHLLSTLLLSMFALAAPAATLTWDGSASGNWSNRTNWVGGVAPVSGDSLIFPVNANRYITTNNFAAGTVFGGIAIHGSNYFFRGSDIVLRDDLRALAESGPVTFDLGITVDSPNAQTQFESRYGSVLRFNDTLHITDADFPLQFIHGVIRVAGAITGPGRVEAINGDLYLEGSAANTFTGTLELGIGNLFLNKTSANTALPPGCRVERGFGGAGWVRWLRDNQVPSTAEFHHLFLDLNGQSETIDDFFTSNVLTNGTLSINRDIVGSSVYLTGNGNGRIYLNPGNHEIQFSGIDTWSSVRYEITGPGNLVKTGSGRMWLDHSNSFTGLLIVSNGIVELADSHALGATNAGAFVRDGATLMLRSSVRIEGEPLSLDGMGYYDPEVAQWLPQGYGALHAISPTNAWNGPITLNGHVSISAQEPGNFLILTNSFLHLGGVISGNGPLVKEGQGTVIFTGTGANTYTSSTVVGAGTLKLDKNGAVAVPGLLGIGYQFQVSTARVELVRGNQIADNAMVLICPGARLHMNNQSDIIQTLRLEDGSLYTDTGALIVTGNIEAIDTLYSPQSNTIYGAGAGRLFFSPGSHDVILTENVNSTYVINVGCEVGGSAALRLLGNGHLHFASSNSFTGPLTVSCAGVAASNPFAFGSTANGTTVSSNAVVALYGTTVRGETLTMLGGSGMFATFDLPARWDGPVILPELGGIAEVWSTSSEENDRLALSGVISGPGDLAIVGGYVMLSGDQNNTQAGNVRLLDGTLLLSKTNAAAIASRLWIGNAATPGSETVRHLHPNQMADDAWVYLYGTGTWDLDGFSETIGQFGGATNTVVRLGAGTLTLNKNTDGLFGFFGVMSGTGGFIKRGTDYAVLAGNNTYTGATLVEAGQLGIWGEQPQSHVTVSPGGTLSGSGTVGHLNAASGGTVAPGYLFSEPVLTSSNLILQAGSTLELILYGHASNHLVRVRGSVTLNAPTLDLVWKYFPSPGDTFRLIDNDGVDAVNGQFANYPAGQFTAPNGMLLEMTYGNDVTLRVLSPGHTNFPPGIGLVVTGGNGNGVIDPNECNQLHISVFNNSTNLLPPFQTMLLCDVPEAVVTQPASAYPAIPALASAYNVTPFQISTTDKLACGSNIPCRLLILTTNGSAFALKLAVPTGAPGESVTYTAAPNAPVLDGILTESAIPVAGLATHLARVEVSVFIEHALSSDLKLTLVAPDGTEVMLAEDLGNGMNYGTNCANAGRTTFADDASASIGSASAPFVGVFRPMGYLSDLRGMPGAEVAGDWKLRVNDHVHFNTGILRCWSLTLAPAACTDGGGQCGPCPGIIVDSIGVNAPLAEGHVSYWTEVSNCFSNKATPDVVPGSFPYRTHTFTNLSVQPTCVTVRFTPKCEIDPVRKIGAVAYLGAFDPANVSANFLGNPAVSLGGGVPRTFSFLVPASNQFQVVVIAYDNPECASYTLEVLSPDLCPVALNIRALDANTMRLDWPTAAAGYELQRAPAMAPGSWSDVNVQPIVTGDRFVVTNEVVDPNGFYRLRKP